MPQQDHPDNHDYTHTSIYKMIEEMKVQCAMLEKGRGIETREIKSLLEELRSLPPEQQIERIQQEFEKKYHAFANKSGLFTKRKSIEEFAHMINKDQNNWHVARMLGLILQQGYVDHTDLPFAPLKQVSTIKLPHNNPAYDAIFQPNLNHLPHDTIDFLSQFFSKHEIAKHAAGYEITIDVKIAKRLWPHLENELKLHDKEIETLLKHGATDELLKTAYQLQQPPLAQAFSLTEERRSNHHASKQKVDKIITEVLETLSKIKQAQDEILTLSKQHKSAKKPHHSRHKKT